MDFLVQQFESLKVEDDCKLEIVERFRKNVKGKEVAVDGHTKHDGREGHWLETMMDIKHNANNAPDLLGYEMKKLSHMITFGDYSASEYLFSRNKDYINSYNKWSADHVKIGRKQFLQMFGKPNPKKGNRFAWSGGCVPKVNEWNSYGQCIKITDTKDIVVYYSYDKDERIDKSHIPEYLKTERDYAIAVWKHDKISKHINSKFNVRGFFLCVKQHNVYNKICFGKPFDYNYFISAFEQGKIIFDSGMYDGNSRNYSHFRSRSTDFWKDLIVEEYE